MPSKIPFTPARTAKKKTSRGAVNREASHWWEHAGKKLASAQLCERCEAVWFDGHWHTAPAMAAMLKAKKKASAKKGKGTKPVLCEECRIAVHGPAGAKDAQYSGQLTLDGLEDPKEKAEILSTARNFGTKQTKRDPEARIISIDDRGKRVVITTTENQMAVGMGKAIAASHKGGTLRIAWSKDDLPARVYWMHKM